MTGCLDIAAVSDGDNGSKRAKWRFQNNSISKRGANQLYDGVE